MKKVIFDVDGVLLSEERYYDVSALTVWELLYSSQYMGLPGEQELFDAASVTEGQIAFCRNKVWGNDRLLSYLKAHGLNSNWDMVHVYLITLIWIMAGEYKKKSGGEKIELRFSTIPELQTSGRKLMGLHIPGADEILARWEASFPKDVVGPAAVHILAEKMQKDFGLPVDWGELQSDFWKIHTDAFQAWYLGDDTYISLRGRKPYSGGKTGFLEREFPLAPAESILALFHELKERGYALGIATGRSEKETEIPFRTFGWYDEFDPLFLATASDAVSAQRMFGGDVPDKPDPFIYICAAFGRKRENFKDYLEGKYRVCPEDQVWVCGDSRSDILGAQRAGCRFIGVLTGLEGESAASMFEEAKVPFVKKVTDILQVLP